MLEPILMLLTLGINGAKVAGARSSYCSAMYSFYISIGGAIAPLLFLLEKKYNRQPESKVVLIQFIWVLAYVMFSRAVDYHIR